MKSMELTYLRERIRILWTHLEFFRTCPRTRDEALYREVRKSIRGCIVIIRRIEAL